MKKLGIILVWGLIWWSSLGVNKAAAKTIALTFDADMTPGMLNNVRSGRVKSYYNEQMANFINQNKIPVTIFLTGLFTQTYENKLQSLESKPFIEFENHSYDHSSFEPKCYKLAVTGNKVFEVNRTNEIIETALGIKPSWFRYPGGCHSGADDKLVNSLGMKIAGWTIVSGDAFSNNSANIVHRVLSQAADKAVVVMHFGTVNAPGTGRALPLIVQGLKRQGFTLVTLNQI